MHSTGHYRIVCDLRWRLFVNSDAASTSNRRFWRTSERFIAPHHPSRCEYAHRRPVHSHSLTPFIHIDSVHPKPASIIIIIIHLEDRAIFNLVCFVLLGEFLLQHPQTERNIDCVSGHSFYYVFIFHHRCVCLLECEIGGSLRMTMVSKCAQRNQRQNIAIGMIDWPLTPLCLHLAVRRVPYNCIRARTHKHTHIQNYADSGHNKIIIICV